MQGLMQDDWGLITTKIIDYAAKVHGNQHIICKTVEGPTVTSTYKQARDRAALCALALRRLGVRPGDRIATLAWNTTRHFEIWYGIPGTGAICHTLNPRLFDKELDYIINHAEDRIIFADISFVDIIHRLLPHLPTVEHVIWLTDTAHMPPSPPSTSTISFLCYEELIAAELGGIRTFQWTECTENQACGLCYTSGTTGNPKGVLYSHRSNFLLAISACLPDVLDIKSNSCFLLLVPMFHANAWGITYAAPFVGAKMVLPGPQLDGASIYSMIDSHSATHSAGVPTLWTGLMEHMTANALPLNSSFQKMIVGGSQCPRHMIEYFEGNFEGVEVRHMWGMTELSPVGTLGAVKGTIAAQNLDADGVMGYKLKQGWPLAFVDMRVVNDAGEELPWDGTTFGNLQVRGPHTLRQYYKADKAAVDAEGWFDTGDVSTIDAEGHMKITDRAKDVIKSGGEWISSIEIEAIAAGHPRVAEAAVIAVADEKWGERPLLVVVLSSVGNSISSTSNSGGGVSKGEILGYLRGKIAKWWVPDDVVFVDSIPHTATGKISKQQLREQLKNYSNTMRGGQEQLIIL